jgi:hypothetical protein
MFRTILSVAGGYLGIAILTMVTFAALAILFPGVFIAINPNKAPCLKIRSD